MQVPQLIPQLALKLCHAQSLPLIMSLLVAMAQLVLMDAKTVVDILAASSVPGDLPKHSSASLHCFKLKLQGRRSSHSLWPESLQDLINHGLHERHICNAPVERAK